MEGLKKTIYPGDPCIHKIEKNTVLLSTTVQYSQMREQAVIKQLQKYNKNDKCRLAGI